MNEDLKKAVLEWCDRMEIPIVGVASVDQWMNPPFLPWMPEEFYPQSIYPEARSVIVIGLPISLPVLETSPSIYYRELYNTVNALLDQHTYRLANFLSFQGYPSIFVPRDGYFGIKALLKKPIAFFSHRHAALLAGLGTFGVNNMLLTPEFGPRVRFGCVFTSAEIPPDSMLEKDLCTKCMQCVSSCPVKALQTREYPLGLTEKMTCIAHSAELNSKGISPCGICIKVCHVGQDRKLYGRRNVMIYDKSDGSSKRRRAWKHVQSYGGLWRTCNYLANNFGIK